MEGQDTININVLIAGRPYPLKIKTKDEVAIRRIVKEINDKINRFQLTYSRKDKQDCLSMAVLTYAVELHKTRQVSNVKELSSKIHQIDDILDYLLQ